MASRLLPSALGAILLTGYVSALMLNIAQNGSTHMILRYISIQTLALAATVYTVLPLFQRGDWVHDAVMTLVRAVDSGAAPIESQPTLRLPNTFLYKVMPYLPPFGRNLKWK